MPTPKIENETKISETTNIYDSNGLRIIRIVEVSAYGYPRICLDCERNIEFIEIKTDQDLLDVLSALQTVARKQMSDKIKTDCPNPDCTRLVDGKCPLERDIIVKLNPETDCCSHYVFPVKQG